MTDIYRQLDAVYRQLIDKAHEAREASYCPYSGYAVGAALLTAKGKIYMGANIENASYTPTVCAERVAFFKAISQGERQFVAIAIVGAPKGEEPSAACPPCGVCRQVMTEFCDGDFAVLLGNRQDYEIVPLSALMPYSFTADNLSADAPEAEEYPEPEEEYEEEYPEDYEEEYDETSDEDLDTDLDEYEETEEQEEDPGDLSEESEEDLYEEIEDFDDLDADLPLEDDEDIEKLLADLSDIDDLDI